MEGLATMNQALTQGLPSCHWVFGGRAHFSSSLPLIVFVKNMRLLNPSLDPACIGGGVPTLADAPRFGRCVHPWGC